MPQTLDMPTLGILFDIDKIAEHVDPGNYLIGAWKVVFRAVGTSSLKEWRGAFLYECDTDGEVGGCCVAIQDMHEPLLHKIRKSVSESSEFQQVAAPPIFLENEEAREQPLMMAGTIDGSGNIIGDEAYCSAPALEAVKAAGSSSNVREATSAEDLPHTGDLSELGADIDDPAEDRVAALITAAQSGDKGVVQALLAEGVDVNRAGIDSCTALYRAAENGHEESCTLC